jgi:hypothetical protein
MQSKRMFLTFSLCCLSACLLAADDHKPVSEPQQLFAPYWTAEPGWHSEFQLRNTMTSAPLTVTPVLRLATGQQYSLTTVTIQPADVVVDVAEELQKISPAVAEQAGTYGSVVFQFTSRSHRNLFAAVMVHEVGQPIGYHIDVFATDDEPHAWSREGIWWLPRPGVKDNLIISNASDKPNRGRLSVFDAAGKVWAEDLQLGPRQTLRLVVGDLVKSAGLSGTYGGIRLDVAERVGSIDTVHFLYDETSGFSALMKMFDHDPEAKLEEHVFGGNTVWTTWAPMLALQNPDPALALPAGTQLRPQILIRNTTAQPQTANVTFMWRNESSKGVSTLAVLRLRPFETHLIDVQALQQTKRIPVDARWALVEVSSATAKPDDLMAIASSYDSTGRYGAQTPFSDQLADYWVGGEFEVDATHNSLMAVGNGGKKPADALIIFHYNHGQSHYEVEQTIAPGDQLWLDLGKIIRGQLPDRKGATFPVDLTSGTYDIRQVKGAGNPSLFEGKIIVDKTYGHLTYGCVGCCGYQAVAYNPNPYAGGVGDRTGNTILAEGTCTNGWDDVTYAAYNWSSTNPPVATVANAYTSLLTVGTSTGSGTVNLLWGNRLKACPTDPKTPQGGINAMTVTITDADLQNNQVNVTLAGPSGPTGILTVTANGSNNHVQVSANNGSAVGVGQYQVSFARPSMPADTYTSVTAKWNLSPNAVSATLNLTRTWWVQGYTEHTVYNTPAESTCATAQGTAFIFVPSTCAFTQTTMSSQFMSQVFENGTGTSVSHGLIHSNPTGLCSSSYPPGASGTNTFYNITSVTGTCNQSLNGNSVATNPNPQVYQSPWSCGDNLLVVNTSNANVGIYTVLDYCPACNTWDPGFGYVAHVDHYSTSNACTLTGLPGNWAADTH